MATNANQPKSRFQITEFVNRGGTQSWRVSGVARDGTRLRQNFANLEAAQGKQLELVAEYLDRRGPEVLKTTTLTDNQLRLAEAAFLRLAQDSDILPAIENWLTDGKHKWVENGKRLDEAVEQFSLWLDSSTLRAKTKINLKSRISIFQSIIGDCPLTDISDRTLDAFLAKRKVSLVTQANDVRALSRFFSFCCDRQRHWLRYNPCSEVQVSKPERHEPEILQVEQCERLLKAAREFRDGHLLGYVALGLFGGLRPFEAARLDWKAVSLQDAEIRLDSSITKVKRSRVVPINKTLQSWLRLCQNKPFATGDWDNGLREIRRLAQIEHWPADVLRHTALSHFFRQTESFGATAEWGGTSEAIIRNHYKGRVSKIDCRNYWGIKP